MGNTNIYLDRFLYSPSDTVGILTLNSRALAFTLEPGISAEHHPAIPAGSYRIDWRPNGRIGTLYRRKGYPGALCLQDVPHREAIEIHAGNDHRDTEGCILLGLSIRDIRYQPAACERSHQAVDAFYHWAAQELKDHELFINIMSISGYDFDDR